MQRQEGKSRCCEMDFCPPVLRCPRLDPSSLFNKVPCLFCLAMSPPGASALLLKDQNPTKNSETNCYPSHTKDMRNIINEWSVNLKIVLPVKLFENNNLAAFFLFIFCGLLLSSQVTSIFVIWAFLYFSLNSLHHLVQLIFLSYTTVFSALK